MNIEELYEYCIKKPGTTAEYPFDEYTLVFKVMGKMYALCGTKEYSGINLKCDPEKAIELREEYPEVEPGYHMSKKHWNTVRIDGNLSPDFIAEMIDSSYSLVVSGLTKKLKAELAEMTQ